MNEITETIVQQLGGLVLLRLLLGTRQVLFNDKGIRFDIHGCKKINQIQIEYDKGVDAYQIKFLHYPQARTDLSLIAHYKEIYCDQLVSLIESETGLYLRPVRIQRVQNASLQRN
jgi:hypothetical protein